MTRLLVEKKLDAADLVGIADMLRDHAAAMDDVWQRAGMLGGAVLEASEALKEASSRVEALARRVEDHLKDQEVVA